MGLMAGIGGMAGGLMGLFGGSNMPNSPNMFQMPNMQGAANNAFSQIGGLGQLSNTGFGLQGNMSNTFGNLYNNPFSGGMLNTAQQGAGIGQTNAFNSLNAGGGLTGFAMNQLPNAQTIMNTAFDPQNALYNRTQQQVTDQSRANAMASGLGATPYGAGLANQATQNFNIDWQNQQLQRQAAGANAAGGLMTNSANVANLGLGIQNAVPGQLMQSGSMPYQAWGQIGGDQNQAISSYLQNATGGTNLANIPIQDYLSYLGVGNQANSVANQLYAAQLQAQNQQFQQQMQFGNMLGRGMYGVGGANQYNSPFAGSMFSMFG